MAKQDSLQGSLDLLVLKILSRRPRLHGYAIMSAISEMSDDVLRAEEGSLYPALHRMEEAGWIRAEWVTKDTGRRARIYEMTAAGKKQLAALLAVHLPRRLCETLLQAAGLPADRKAAALSRSDRVRLVGCVKRLPLAVTGTLGSGKAEGSKPRP